MAAEAQDEQRVVSGSGRQSRTSVIVLFSSALVIVFASAIVLTLLLQPDGFLWPLVLLGACVIAILVAAAALPYLQRQH